MVGKKKRKEEEPENHERWMVSYADFLTLLFAFFTVMYAMSTVDAQKMGQMVASMRASFDSSAFERGSKNLTLSQGLGGAAEIGDILQDKMEQSRTDEIGEDKPPSRNASLRQILTGEAAMGRMKRSIEAILGNEIKKDRIRVRLEQRGLVVSLGENGVFDSGSAQLKPEGKAILDTLAATLSSIGNQIRVEGHTDNVPIKTDYFPSNWELSSARATNVVLRLINNFGLSPELLSASGFGEYRPIESNDTDFGRARNRRVDIVILNPAIARIEPKTRPGL